MIKFYKHKAWIDKKLWGIFRIKRGTEVVKICFSPRDVHVNQGGEQHLDIWGKKLEELKNLLCESDIKK